MPSKRLILFSFLMFVIISIASIQTSALPLGSDLVAGRNVNMVNDDPYLQRQNEPSFDVSSLNPRHLLAGANDYSLVDFYGDEVDVTYDAWLGVFKSYDGGESWEHDLLPPYQGVLKGGSVDSFHPLHGFDAAADPTIRAGKNGWFYYSGIAFNRDRNGRSVVFVIRFKDNGSSINYVDTTIIDEGTSGQFQDKPWIGTDKDNRVYIIYSIFLGEIDNNIHSKIMISRSLNGGNTWLKPTKISEGQQKNQGTTIAIDQNYDTIYVAWRRFRSVNATDAILIVKSEDFGATFTKAEEVATIDFPFDQPTMGSQFGASQFRTNSYPTIAVDDSGRIYLAWTERISDLGDARIVITSQARGSWGASWPPAQVVETPFAISIAAAENPEIATRENIPGFQFMPTMLFSPGAGKLLIAWFDTRFSARRYDEFGGLRSDACSPSGWIRDGDGCPYRETVDVRLAQADPGPAPIFDDSIQVSRYLWVLEEDPDPEPGNYRLRQGQFNPPNYKMFSGGTKPFHGDYIDIAHSPDDPFTFYVTWTDNRDVRPPDNDGFWGSYIPPQPFDPGTPCDPAESVAGMRNQNVYCSKITRGVNIGTLNNNLAPGNTSFVIFVQNLLNPQDPEDPYASEDFNLTILNSDSASFAPLTEPLLPEISVSVPFYSTIARQVFVDGYAGDTFRVSVYAPNVGFYDEISLKLMAGGAPGGIGSIVLNGTTMIDWNDPELIAQLNPSITNPSITNPAITNPSITNPAITNPSITNPAITNPAITNPSITNPAITNPGITNPSITNPTITNPTITNPSITNPSITNNVINPSITNPSITNIPPQTRVADKVWSVHNDGNGVSAYTFKGIAGDTLPADGYVFSQLLIYKVHYTHSTNGCYLLTEAHHELLVNVVNPILTTDTTGWTEAEIKKFIGDPEAANALIENATFSLAPDEHAVLILRVVDTKINRVLSASSVRTLSDPFTPAPINYDEAGSVFVPHSSTESNPTGTASLMILPQSLPFGIKAGEVFPTTTFRAIGGILNSGSDYIWSHTWLEPSGLYDWGLAIVGNVLSGSSRWIGPISFTMEATDDNGDTDSHTFYGVIDPPDPLALEMTPAPANSKEGDTHTFTNPLATFTASGGVAPYSWTFIEVPVAPTSLPSGLSLQPTGNPGEMDLVGTLTAGEWNIAVKITDDRLPVDTTAYAEVEFKLCVSPLPLEINLPDASNLVWSLGTSHTIQISVSNAKSQPSWIVEGLPDGFELTNISGSPVGIMGSPVFDPSVDYPATYQITVEVTDSFTWCGFGPRTEGATFNIIVNPKAPEWDNEETNGGVATAVAADQNGNTYVTGHIGAEGSRDYLTVKYDSQGNKVWSVTYDGPSGGDDMPKAIAADETGAYVTGFSEGTTSGKDIYTVKYNPDGSQAWDLRYDGPSHLGDEANAIAQDGAHVYVAGFVHRGNKSAHKDKVIIKINKDNRDIVWDVSYDSTRNGKDEVTAIAVDSSGNVYATGKSQEGGNTPKSFDYLTLKFNNSGRLLWKVRDDGFFFGDDEPSAIAVDAAGNVCVTGWQNMGINDTNFYTVKYNSDGQSIWTSGQSYGGSGEDKALAMAFDETGNVYVTGKVTGSDGLYDYATIRYSSAAGNQEWADIYDSGNGENVPVGLAFSLENSEGFVYVAGYKTTQNHGKDYFCIKYKAEDRGIVWIGQYNSTSGTDDKATALFMHTTGLYLTGFTPNGFLTVKYNN